MKKKIIILYFAILPLVAYATNGGNANTKDSNDTEIGATASSSVEITSGTDTVTYVTYDQFDILKSEVEGLKATLEENSDSSAGYGWFEGLLSLVLGVAGGICAFLFLEKNRKTGKEELIEMEGSSAKPSKVNNSSGIGKASSKKSQSQNQTKNKRVVETSNIQSAERPTVQPMEGSKEDTTQDSTVFNVVDEVQKEEARSESKNLEVQKSVFGNISIPTRDMLIIPADAFSDSEIGNNFSFNLNEIKGTGTYSFSPSVELDAINRLSALEPFIEPFRFNSSATKVVVEKPGTIINRGEYWQVESKIVISLS